MVFNASPDFAQERRRASQLLTALFKTFQLKRRFCSPVAPDQANNDKVPTDGIFQASMRRETMCIKMILQAFEGALVCGGFHATEVTPLLQLTVKTYIPWPLHDSGCGKRSGDTFALNWQGARCNEMVLTASGNASASLGLQESSMSNTAKLAVSADAFAFVQSTAYHADACANKKQSG